MYFDSKDTHLWGYWVAGLGVYGVTRSDDGSYLRPGWNVGFGWRISDATFVEARYHGIFHPAVFGVRF